LTWCCRSEIATPVFDPILILTMTLVMIVVMIESTGMFLALGDMTGRKVTSRMLTPACAPMAWAP
jgi:xanthine/uracil permease